MANLRDAAVLVPVYRDADGALRLVLVLRGPGGIHGSQVALPGGKPEPTDASLQETALREAKEEIGLPPEDVTVLARLPAFDTLTSGFHVTPFLARIKPPATAWQARAGEVAAVLDASVAELTRPEVHGEEEIRAATWPAPRRVPVVRVGPHIIWGLTYRILDWLVPRLRAGEWPV